MRRLPDSLKQHDITRGRVEVDQTKPQQSLAELYENDHLRATDPSYVDPKNEKLKKLCRAMQTGGYGNTAAAAAASGVTEGMQGEVGEFEGETESEYDEEDEEYEDDLDDEGIEYEDDETEEELQQQHGRPSRTYGPPPPPPPPHVDHDQQLPNGTAKGPLPADSQHVNGTVNGTLKGTGTGTRHHSH